MLQSKQSKALKICFCSEMKKWRKLNTRGDNINMIEENEINGLCWYACSVCRRLEIEPERERAREATRAGARMTDALWALRRPIGSLGSPELLQRRSERGFSHTHILIRSEQHTLHKGAQTHGDNGTHGTESLFGNFTERTGGTETFVDLYH